MNCAAYLAAFVTSISDIDDLVPILTSYQIEWNKLREKLLGREHPDYAYTLMNYSMFLFDRGRYEEATRLARAVLALQGSGRLDIVPVGRELIVEARLAPADSQRIQRALEVYRVSGKPLSTFHAQQDAIKKEAARAYSACAGGLFVM